MGGMARQFDELLHLEYTALPMCFFCERPLSGGHISGKFVFELSCKIRDSLIEDVVQKLWKSNVGQVQKLFV